MQSLSQSLLQTSPRIAQPEPSSDNAKADRLHDLPPWIFAKHDSEYADKCAASELHGDAFTAYYIISQTYEKVKTGGIL